MRTIENIKSGRNYAAVNVGSIDQIIEHQLPMGPNVIQGKVFVPAHPQDPRGALHHPARQRHLSGRRRTVPRQRRQRGSRQSRRPSRPEEHRQREPDDALHPVPCQQLHRGRQPYDRRQHPQRPVELVTT